LPSMFLYTLTPEHFVARINQDDAGVRAIPVTINHRQHPENGSVVAILS